MPSAADYPLHARPESRVFHGWNIILVAAAAMVGTLPGRTQGLGLITEPLLRDLGLHRVTYAQLNLWATLAGALFAIGVGRMIDRHGGRLVLTTVAAILGAVVCFMSQTTSMAGLALWVTLTRGFGQSALSVISIALVGQWFVRRIEMAMAVYSVLLSIGFMAAFPAVGWIVQAHGWRPAWLAIGLVLLVGLAPLSWLAVGPGTPEPGQTGVGTGSDPGLTPGVEWGAAMRTPAFWTFALGTALYGLVASGIGLFNESILAERGFGPDIYYQTLAVTAMTGLAGNFAGGFLAARMPLGRLLAASMFILTLGLAVLPHVMTKGHVMMWAAAMGVGGGIVMVLFFSAWPRLFGRRHLGRIQGSAQALTVIASAIGPLLLALCVSWTGSYAAMFRILAALVAAVGFASLAVRSAPANRAPHTV